jgi:hypothetical protein
MNSTVPLYEWIIGSSTRLAFLRCRDFEMQNNSEMSQLLPEIDSDAEPLRFVPTGLVGSAIEKDKARLVISLRE